MNKYNFCFLTLIVFFTALSCKKSKKTTLPPVIDTPVVYDNYTKLTPGNYWVYQDYKLDSVNGAAHAQGTFDSVFVEKDTIINGNTYHKYWDVNFDQNPSSASYYSVSFLRDSLSYTVNNTGTIMFSSTDFSSVFKRDTIFPGLSTPDTIPVTFQMGFKDLSITVDAGTFVTSSYREVLHNPASYAYGQREYDHRYCKNIGLISYTTGIYDAEPWVFERRLERYHVK